MKKKYLFVIIPAIIILTVISISIMRVNSKKQMSENQQWWIENEGQAINGISGNCGIDINIVNTWEETKGDNTIVVGIIDSGIDISCNELKDCIYINNNEIPDNGIDDDDNGYIDDINGWNFYDSSNEVYTSFTSDYHGTMIAGIIAGKHTSNGKFGVASDVKVLPLKCFKGSEGGIEDIVSAIHYGYNLGVRIFNCSWDTSNYYEDLKQVMEEYSDAVFICAGGKEAQELDDTPVYPACYDLNNVICVGGINSMGEIYEYSGYGKDVDIYAPGESIYCVMPENTYTYSEGTSLSVAFISGAVALLKSREPEVTVIQVKERLSNCYNESIKLNFLNVDKICFLSK